MEDVAHLTRPAIPVDGFGTQAEFQKPKRMSSFRRWLRQKMTPSHGLVVWSLVIKGAWFVIRGPFYLFFDFTFFFEFSCHVSSFLFLFFFFGE